MNKPWFDGHSVHLTRRNMPFESITYGAVDTLFGSFTLAFDKNYLLYFAPIASVFTRKLLDADTFIHSNTQAQEFFDTQLEQSEISVQIYTTDFAYAVYEVLIQIPPYAKMTYSQIAQRIQKKKAIRAVGNAVGKNPVIYLIPCHKVIRKDGALGGFSSGIELKKAFLKYDGVSF